MFLEAITENEVEEEISGHDEISPEVVRKITTYIVKPLKHIFGRSFLTGIVPNQLNITPVFKANERELRFSNFYIVRGAEIWNNLPDNLKNKRSYNSFKCSVKSFKQMI